jgi:hypothetical protein
VHDLARGLDAIEADERDVHEHDVGLVRQRLRHRVVAALDLGDDLDVALGLEQQSKSLAQGEVIFSEHHADFFGVFRHCPALARPWN